MPSLFLFFFVSCLHVICNFRPRTSLQSLGYSLSDVCWFIFTPPCIVQVDLKISYDLLHKRSADHFFKSVKLYLFMISKPTQEAYVAYFDLTSPTLRALYVCYTDFLFFLVITNGSNY